MIKPNPTESFDNCMRSKGFEVKGGIINDGQIHRFHVTGDKPSSQNGWYVLNSQDISFGAFGSWRTGSFTTWRQDFVEEMTPAERRRIDNQISSARKQQLRLKSIKQDETAKKAKTIWDRAHPADTDHTYIKTKKIKPFHLRQLGDKLIVPLINENHEIRNLQLIQPSGDKRFLSGGQVKGCFSMIGTDINRKVLVCEGFATGATLHEALGYSVLCSMNAGNLESISRIAVSAFKAVVVICADNDHKSINNTGIQFASIAARKIGADLTWPDACGKQCKCTDFNDLVNCRNQTGR